jgi:hypothetical protein
MATIINADTSDGLKLTSDTSGEIQFQSAGVVKAQVTSGGLQDASGNSITGGEFRNIAINGDMRIAQRSTSTASITSGGYYTVDRFSWSPNTMGTWTMSQDTDVPSGQGFANSLKLQCTTADASPAAGDFLLLGQAFEGQNLQYLKKGTANAQSLTLSFWIKAYATGTFIIELVDADNTRSISKSFTIDSAGTWEKKTLTFAGDTTGTLDNDNNNSLSLYFWMGAGSTYTSGTLQTSWGAVTSANRAVGVSNLAASTSHYFNVTGIQLEANTGASSFEFLPVDVQLQRCQRYYYKWNTVTANNFLTFAMAANTTTLYGILYFPTTMRSNPSSVDYGSGWGWWLGGGLTSISAVGIGESGNSTVNLTFTTTGVTAEKMYGILPGGATNYIGLSAEI